jgi:transcriptional regulator
VGGAASEYPVLLHDASAEMAVLTHVGRPDEIVHDPELGGPSAKGTVGLRIPISRLVCKIELSHDKGLENKRRVTAALRAPGPYHHPDLADEMERSIAD